MPSLDDEIRALRGEYLQDARHRLSELERLLMVLGADPGNDAVLEQVMRRFHGFAGSGLTHGFTRITQIGQEGEHICAARLDHGEIAGPDERKALPSLARLIAQELDAAEDTSPSTTEDVGAAPRLLCVETDEALTVRLRRVLESAGYEVHLCASPRDLGKELSAFNPDLILTNASLREATQIALAHCARPNGIAIRLVTVVAPIAPGDLLDALQSLLSRAGSCAMS